MSSERQAKAGEGRSAERAAQPLADEKSREGTLRAVRQASPAHDDGVRAVSGEAEIGRSQAPGVRQVEAGGVGTATGHSSEDEGQGNWIDTAFDISRAVQLNQDTGQYELTVLLGDGQLYVLRDWTLTGLVDRIKGR